MEVACTATWVDRAMANHRVILAGIDRVEDSACRQWAYCHLHGILYRHLDRESKSCSSESMVKALLDSASYHMDLLP